MATLFSRVRPHLVTFFLALLLAGVALPGRSQTFDLKIVRQHSDEHCTSGYLSVDGRTIAYTLERPWQGNASDISSIPPGTYGAELRYDKERDDYWTIQLRGVPGRTAVQLHIGNTTADTTGCLLVGTRLTSNLCSVIDSGGALRRIKQAFYGDDDPVMSPNKSIRVTIVDDRVTFEGTWTQSCSIFPGQSELIFARSGASYSGRVRKNSGPLTGTFSLSDVSADDRTKRLNFRWTPPEGYAEQTFSCQLGDDRLDCSVSIPTAWDSSKSCTYRRSR
jgi:hypothetical protein